MKQKQIPSSWINPITTVDDEKALRLEIERNKKYKELGIPLGVFSSTVSSKDE